MTPEISLILPAYNEARVIPATIGEAVRYFESRGLSYQIIVAADGAAIPAERILGKVVESDNFQNARKFLLNGGERLRQGTRDRQVWIESGKARSEDGAMQAREE